MYTAKHIDATVKRLNQYERYIKTGQPLDTCNVCEDNICVSCLFSPCLHNSWSSMRNRCQYNDASDSSVSRELNKKIKRMNKLLEKSGSKYTLVRK